MTTACVKLETLPAHYTSLRIRVQVPSGHTEKVGGVWQPSTLEPRKQRQDSLAQATQLDCHIGEHWVQVETLLQEIKQRST